MSTVPESSNHNQGVNSARIIIKRKPPRGAARSYSMKNLSRFLGITALAAVVGFAMAACSNPAGDPPSGPPPTTFVAVTDIDNVSSGGARNVESDLSGAVVHPTDATHKDIVWSVKEAGGTGVADIVDNKFTPIAAGTLVLTATIANGSAEGTPYTKDFTIVIDANITPVTNITGIPATGIVNESVDLSGPTITPNNATYQSISWSVKTAGAGITSITGTSFTPTARGSVTLTATIANGVASGTPYTKDFTIAVDVRPVTDITLATTTVNAKAALDLSSTNATVTPDNATFKSISWSVKTAGAGVSTGTGNITGGNSVTPPLNGTFTLTATIANGAVGGASYTKDFDITVNKVVVTSITGVPTTGVENTPVELNVAVVNPDNATYKTIVWSIKETGGVTGITAGELGGTTFTPTSGADAKVTVTATITDGAAAGNYTEDFEITISSS
jgi:hypothetical protein